LPEPPVSFSIGGDREPPSLGLLRETRGSDAVQVQRVVYRLRDGVFERGFSLWAAPSPDGSREVPATPFTWQPIMSDVQAIEFKGWLDGRGWMPAATLGPLLAAAAAAPPPDAAPTPVPRAVLPQVTGVELTLVRRNERIVRVFAVAD
jgi:hypothetical protein